MVLRLYTLGVYTYTLLIRLASLRSEKARMWLTGRRGWKARLAGADLRKPIWFHCASVGEFEQARPVIESLRGKMPEQHMLLTFFSPSGYELRKAYDQVDHVAYLPADLPENMRVWIDLVDPSLVVFTKYDFWFNLMQQLHDRQVPMTAISVHLPARHWFFRWPGTLMLPRLQQFERIFVQDDETAERLSRRGLTEVQTTGDTRVDRVLSNAAEPFDMTALATFAKDRFVVVAGSIWPRDSELLLSVSDALGDVYWIIAPHEANKGILKAWQQRFDASFYHWSDRNKAPSLDERHRIVFVDFVGLLSKLYRHASVAYVGGGFNAGIHNILEPAAYGIPVLFGPRHQRFREAGALLATGQGIEVNDPKSLEQALGHSMQQDPEVARQQADEYFGKQRGATEQITAWIEGLSALGRT